MMRVDIWSTGVRGDIVQRPLVEALLGEGTVSPRLVYCAQSPGADPLAKFGLPECRTAGTRRLRDLPRLVVRVARARRQLASFYAHGAPETIVHLTMESPWDQFYLDIPKRAGAKILVVVHDAIRHEGEESWLMLALRARLLRMADAVALLSPYAGETFRRAGGYDGPIHVVSPGLIMDASEPRPAKHIPATGPMRFLFFGRLQEYKGLGVLLDAWERFQELPAAPPATLTIVGSGPIDRHLARIATLRDCTLEHGWVTDARMAEVFVTHHVNLLPYSEGSESATALAGMWAGMPAIATDIPAFEGKFIDNENALLIPRDADQLCQAMLRLASNRALFERLAIGTHVSAMNWTAPTVAARWVQLYRQLVASG